MGIPAARARNVARRLALKKITHATGQMTSLARHAKPPPAPCLLFTPDRAAPGPTVPNAMRNATQRQFYAVCERCRFRQPLQPRGNPAAMLLSKLLGLTHAPAGRHGEDNLPQSGIDAQGIT